MGYSVSRPKNCLKCAGKAFLLLAIVLLAAGLFVRYQGVQYTLATLTGTWGSAPDLAIVTGENAPCGGQTPCESNPIRVLTFNIFCRMCSHPDSGYEPWDARVPHLVEVMQRYQPDLIGLQETGTQADLNDLLAWNPSLVVHTWRAGPLVYADAALAYDATRFEPLDSGWFWLNPNPALPFGWAWRWQSMPRYVTWIWLREVETGFVFLYTNTHFDNNAPNKEAAALLFNDMLAETADFYPIISTGDFNTEPTSQRYANLRHGDPPRFVNTHDLAPAPAFPDFDALDLATPPPGRYQQFESLIDHIFVAGPIEAEVREWRVDANLYGDGQRASDHPAVFAELILRIP